MFDSLSTQVAMGITALIVGFAFWKGDEPERLGAGTYVVLWLASLLIMQNRMYVEGVARWMLMGVDTVMLLTLIGLTWKSRRSWPIWAAALQSLVVMSHVLTLVHLRPTHSAMQIVFAMAGYGVLICIGIGTFWAWQERRAAGME